MNPRKGFEIIRSEVLHAPGVCIVSRDRRGEHRTSGVVKARVKELAHQTVVRDRLGLVDHERTFRAFNDSMKTRRGHIAEQTRSIGHHSNQRHVIRLTAALLTANRTPASGGKDILSSRR